MDELWSRLEALTQQTMAQLHTMTEEQLLDFVDQRENILDCMKLAQGDICFKENYRERCSRILQHDSVIRQRMKRLLLQNQLEIAKIQNAKKQKNVYDTEPMLGSVLFDKRK